MKINTDAQDLYDILLNITCDLSNRDKLLDAFIKVNRFANLGNYDLLNVLTKQAISNINIDFLDYEIGTDDYIKASKKLEYFYNAIMDCLMAIQTIYYVQTFSPHDYNPEDE